VAQEGRGSQKCVAGNSAALAVPLDVRASALPGRPTSFGGLAPGRYRLETEYERVTELLARERAGAASPSAAPSDAHPDRSGSSVARVICWTSCLS
jgi:hypothetical protein